MEWDQSINPMIHDHRYRMYCAYDIYIRGNEMLSLSTAHALISNTFPRRHHVDDHHDHHVSPWSGHWCRSSTWNPNERGRHFVDKNKLSPLDRGLSLPLCKVRIVSYESWHFPTGCAVFPMFQVLGRLETFYMKRHVVTIWSKISDTCTYLSILDHSSLA